MSLEEILSKIPALSEMDKEIFRSMPPGLPDKFLQKTLTADKQANPFVYGPLSILFDVPPKVAGNLLLNNTTPDENLYLAKFIQSFQRQLIDWLDNNRTTLAKLALCSENFEMKDEGESFYLIGINEITEKEEQKYLTVTNNVEYQKRIKALAAVEMIALYEQITQTFKYTGVLAAKAAMVYTFLYMRSFVQFTAAQSVGYGISVHAGTRTKEREKNRALFALKAEYKSLFPKADQRKLWREIHKALSSGNYFEYDEYWIEFKPGDDRTDIYCGTLVQRTEKKEDISWNFSTFRRKKIPIVS